MTEQWKPIKENPEYQISSYGRVLGKRGNIRKLCVKKDGRLAVIISVNGKQKEFLIHRLVAQAFIPNPNNYPEIHHKDKNYQNNRADNLEWVDKKTHMEYHTSKEKRPYQLSEKQKERKKEVAHLRYMRKREEMLEYSKRYYQDNIDGAREKRKQRWRETHNWQGHIYKKNKERKGE